MKQLSFFPVNFHWTSWKIRNLFRIKICKIMNECLEVHVLENSNLKKKIYIKEIAIFLITLNFVISHQGKEKIPYQSYYRLYVANLFFVFAMKAFFKNSHMKATRLSSHEISEQIEIFLPFFTLPDNQYWNVHVRSFILKKLNEKKFQYFAVFFCWVFADKTMWVKVLETTTECFWSKYFLFTCFFINSIKSCT